MTITDNPNVHWTPFNYPHDEYDGMNYHVFFAYNIEYTVTEVANINVILSNGKQPINVTAERLTHSEMAEQGNIYAIHIELAPYYTYKHPTESPCNIRIALTGEWVTEELPISIPISTQIIQVGCTGPLIYTDPTDGTIYSQGTFELGPETSVVVKDGKYYIRLSSNQMYVMIDLEEPMEIGQTIKIHTREKNKPAITGEDVRSQHNSMIFDGGVSGDYVYSYTIVGDEQDSQEKLEGRSVLYVWKSGSSTDIISVDVK